METPIVTNKQSEDFEKVEEICRLFGNPDTFENTFFDNDWAYPFSSDGKKILLYPATVAYYTIFHVFATSLLLSKNMSGDVKAISMSYLEYIFYLAENGDGINLVFLTELLLICLKLPRTTTKDGNVIPSVEIARADDKKVYLLINGERWNATEFDKIRQIILQQNALEAPREDIHPDILEAYKEYEEFLRKRNKVKICSFADQLNVIMLKTAYTKETIMGMTIRTFTKLLERADLMLNYEISTLLSPYMSKDGVQKITHYLSDTTRDKYKDMYVDYDEFRRKNNL